MTSTCKCNNQYEQFNEKGNRLHRCPACYARQGRRNKRKGKAKEKDVEKLLLSVVGGVIRRTPGSGAMANFSGDDWAGDLWFKDNFLADDKVVAEIKHGYSSFSKRWIEQANELGDWGLIPKWFVWWTGKHSRTSIVTIPFAWHEYLNKEFSQLNYGGQRFPKKEALEEVIVWHPRGYIPLAVMPHEIFLKLLKNHRPQ